MRMSDKESTGTFNSPPATGGKAIRENWEQQNKKPDPFFAPRGQAFYFVVGAFTGSGYACSYARSA